MAKLRVSDYMQKDVALIRQDSDVHELEQLLLRERIHGVPVVDHEGRLIGVVSQTDLLNWHYTSGVDTASFYKDTSPPPAEVNEPAMRVADIRTERVSEIMSPLIHCICENQSIQLAAARMLVRHVHRLVVVDDDGRVLGILSATDLLRAVPGVEDLFDEARDERRFYQPHP